MFLINGDTIKFTDIKSGRIIQTTHWLDFYHPKSKKKRNPADIFKVIKNSKDSFETNKWICVRAKILLTEKKFIFINKEKTKSRSDF